MNARSPCRDSPIMTRRPGLVVGFLAVLAVVGLGLWWWVNAPPRDAAEALARARATEARQAGAVQAARFTGVLTPEKKAELIRPTKEAYRLVEALFPGAPEVEEADWRLYQMADEDTTAPDKRIQLAQEFLDKHTSSSRQADLQWRVAELTHRELKRLLDAVGLYEKFATEHRSDRRAPEALLRIGQIYEEIREFSRALQAYERVVAEFPRTAEADQAQFRVGSLLAEQLERREEAMKAFEQLEREGSGRLAQQAGEERRRLSEATETAEQEQKRTRYYGGVREVPAFDRMLESLDAPPFLQLRQQGMDLVGTTGALTIDPLQRSLQGEAVLTVLAQESTATMIVHLGTPLKVTSVTADLGEGFQRVAFDHREDFVFLDFGRDEVPAQTTFSVALSWTGEGREPWGMIDRLETTSTLLVGNRMLPALNLGDKRPVEFSVTVPSGWSAVASAELLEEVDGEVSGTITRRFRMEEPIYWTAVGVARYLTSVNSYESTVTGRTLPLAFHRFPETSEATAEVYFKALQPILSYYEQLLGPFPYPKLEIAQVTGLPGGLGSPGLIFLGPPAFEKPDAPAVFLAHEVSHAWFGNLVSLDLSPDSPVWLSEGFAEYLDALFVEAAEGSEALARTMRERAIQFHRMTARIRERPLADLRGNIVALAPSTYIKGAYVLHVLRSYLGDELFARLLRTIIQRHSDRLFTLTDLEAIAEEVSGESLEWFFQQWVRGVGIPRLDLDRACTFTKSDGTETLRIEISQSSGREFRLPLDLELELTDGQRWPLRVNIRDASTTIELQPPSSVLRVHLDPRSWILKHPRPDGWAREVVEGCSISDGSTTDTATVDRESAASSTSAGLLPLPDRSGLLRVSSPVPQVDGAPPSGNESVSASATGTDPFPAPAPLTERSPNQSQRRTQSRPSSTERSYR